MEAREIYKAWLSDPYFDEETKRELEALAKEEKEIEDRFGRELEFGTGGLRGIMGAGTNRMNSYMVRKATQGLANYMIKQKTEKKGVAIAFDSRNNSARFVFAEMVASVLEALLGSQWGGAGTVLPGLLQGLGAELAFALCAYGVWNMAVTALSGALSALGGFTASWMLYGMGKSGLVLTVGIVCNVLSGAVVAGVLMWVLYRGLAGTGALDRLAGGRAAVKAAAPVVADPEA